VQSFCGYHEHIENVYYAVIPFVNCAGCVFPGEILDTLTEVCSHELAEAVTDPELNAWWDPVNDEIGDICNRHAARLGGFLVQTEWSNAEQACVLVAPRVACVTNPQGDLRMCALDRFWGLWYAIRMADGTWPFAFGDVQAQTRLIGPNAGIGPTPYVTCATNPQGNLHVCAIDQARELWHTIRMADGTWPFAFGDVQAAMP
jgi:hypothetical protein